MSKNPFLFGLLGAALISLVLLLLFHQSTPFADHQLLSWIGLAFFLLLSIAMYFIGKRTAQSDNKNTFTSAVIGFTMFKLLFAASIILIYNQMVQPDSKLFVLPFFSIYLIFTIFETYFMMKLGSAN